MVKQCLEQEIANAVFHHNQQRLNELCELNVEVEVKSCRTMGHYTPKTFFEPQDKERHSRVKQNLAELQSKRQERLD
jgi:hypothetical protein